MARTLLFLVTTLSLALTAHADLPRCSVECPVVGNHKLGYVPGQRYVYKQSGESSLSYQNKKETQTNMQWSSMVELSVLTPCDVAITIKEFQMNGKDSSAVPELAEVSERPLIMAISDGKVQHVCVDPQDNTWAVNAKMSVASYLQNTLPSFSEINKETIITERDIQGKCSTNYTLTSTSQSDVHVVKQKDNKRCEDRFYQPSETSNNLPWLNMPLPLEVSNSTCHQTIKNGIYTSVKCTDVNVLKPMYGVYKNVTATQKSTLHFQSKVQVDPALLKFSSNHLVKKQLKFDYTTPKKTNDVVPKLENLLKQISVMVQKSVEPETASLVHQVMILLRHAPDSQLQIILQNIRRGAYGQNTQKLEQIYLDALTFLRESGVVPVMVQEISQGKASLTRTALYAVAMHLLPRPNTFAIESLVPLFQMSQPPKTVLLAAASMLNTYLRQHPQSREEKHVQHIITIVTTKLQGLRNAQTTEERDHAKLLLKALSNVGHLPQKTVSVVESLILDKSVDTSIRVVATQTSKHIPCNLLEHRKLLQPYNDTEESTEIRIASYLSAIRCVTNMTELDQIVQRVFNETNIQVRSFVITHLTNLQETSSPHKDHLRYLLSTTVLPTDYVADIRKFSRNTELSYFLRTLGLGAEMDSNLVYSREAVLPRSVNMNMTLDLLGNMLNVVEVGARMEGFNPLVEGAFGPEGYLTSIPWDQVLRDINPFDKEGRSNIVEIVNQILRSRTNSGSSSSEIKSFLENKVRSRQHEKMSPEIDLYLRLFGQEVSFASLTSDVLQLLQQKLSITSLPSDLITFIQKQVLSYLTDSQLNMVRALPINLEYTIPTMQGIPLDLSLDGAAVLGLDSTSKVDLSTDNPKVAFKAVPSLSLQLDAFVGFKSIIRHGIKMENKLHTSNGGRVQVDVQGSKLVKIQWIPLPQNLNMLYFKSQTNLVKEWSPVLQKQQQQIILPQPQGDVPPFKVDKCLDRLQQDLGYQICFNANIPDLIRSTSVPFGQPIQVKITAQKTGAPDKGFSITASTTGQNDQKDISLVLETPGQAVAKVNYRNQENSHTLSVTINSSILKYSVESRLLYVNDKIDLIVHTSPTFDSKPSTPVFQLLWIPRSSKGYVLKARTENQLREIIHLEADVAIEVSYYPYSLIPSHVKVHQWKVDAKVSQWELLQRVETTPDMTDFQLKLINKGIPQVDISIKMTPIHFTIDGYTTVTLWNTGIKSIVALHLNDKGVNATWNVLNTRSTEKVLYASALVTRQEKDKVSYDSHIQLHIPSVLDKVDIEGRIEKEDDSKYHVEGTTKHHNQVIYKISGPITLDVTGKSVVNLEITGSSQVSYKLIGQLENSDKKLISIVVQNPNNNIFKAEIESVPKSDGGNLVLTILEIPSLIKTKMGFHLSRNIIDVYIYNNILPEGQYEQTIKGSYSHSFVENKVTTNFLWKTRNGEPLEINLETKYALEKGAPLTLRGNLVLNGRSHGYNTKIDISILPMFEGQNRINFACTTATGKKFEITANLDKKIHPQKHSLTGSVHLKTVHDNNYKLTGKYELERLQGPWEYKLQTNIDLVAPQCQVEINAIDMKTGRERNVEITVDIPRSEVKAYFQGMVTTSNFKTTIDVKRASEQQILIKSHGQIASQGVGLIKSGELNADVKLPFQVSKVFQVKSRMDEDGSMHAHISVEPKRWKINVRKSASRVLDVEVETPSRTVEAKVVLDSTNPSIQLWPNKGKTQDNIEISAKVSQTKRKNKQVLTIDGKFKVSQLNKEILFSTEYSNSTSELSGYLELKTPQSSEGLILLTLRGKKEHGIHANVSLSLKGTTPTKPIRAQMVWTNSTKAIVLHSQTKEVLVLKYQQIVPEEASLWAKLKTSTIDTEVSTILRTEKTSYCHGLNIHANYKLQSQKYQTIARLCRPAYVQLVTFKKTHDNNHRNYVSVGMKSPYQIELDLHVEKPGKNLLQRYADVLTIKADVTTPRVLDLVAHYDTEGVQQTKRELEMLKTQLYESWHSIVQELREHQIYQSMKMLGVDKIYESISKELYDISEDLYKDNLIPNPDDIYIYVAEMYIQYMDIIEDIFGTYKLNFPEILKELKRVLVQLKELYEQDRLTPHEVIQILSHLLPLEEIKEFFQEFKEEHPETYQSIIKFWEILKKVIGQLLPNNMSGETGSYSAEYQKLYESIFNTVNTITKLVYPEGILKHLENRNPEMYATLRYVVFKVLDNIKQDAHHLIKTSPVRQVIDWLLYGYKFDDVTQTDALIDSLYQLLVKNPRIIYDSTTEKQLHLRVPFIYPEYSLTAVPYGRQISTGLDLIRRIIGTIQRILPVHYKPLDRVMSSVAVYHGDGYLTTFDGTSIKLPESHCQYILTTDGYDYVAVTNLPGNKNEFELTVENGRHKIAIDKDYQVYINGTKTSEEEVHSSSHHLVVYQTPMEVVVVSPTLQLVVLKRAPTFRLYASTELQGRLKGVMATFNDFQGDDIMMPNGRITHNPTAFLKSWQVKPSC